MHRIYVLYVNNIYFTYRSNIVNKSKILVLKTQVDHTYSQGTTRPSINPLNANPTKWPNTLKQFVGNFPINCLSVFDHFAVLALKVST